MLKALKLRVQLEQKRAELKALEEKDLYFKKRSEELTAQLDAAESPEALDAVAKETEALEKEKEEHEKDQDQKKKDLNETIQGIEAEIKETESKVPQDLTAPVDKRDGAPQKMNSEVRGFMRDVIKITPQNPLGQTREDRMAYLKHQDVKEFYERFLDLAKENRAVNGAEIGIPEVMLGVFRDVIDNYSALLRAVTLRRIRGEGKAIIPGEIPEAVWTECCATINELDINFSEMYVYCHKVAGYIPVCNADLEDFGVAGLQSLAAEIEYNLLMAIGMALNKAIIYGDGENMPLGFVRSLTLTKNPLRPSEEWDSLADTNIKKVTGEGLELFKGIMKAVAGAKSHTSRGNMTFIMNENTWRSVILPESLAINSAGTMVAAGNSSFPALGGNIIFLNFIPDGDIIGGYLDNYLLVERANIKMARSEHRMFIEDYTLFKATARYDGTPIPPYRDSFFAINVNGQNPATTMSFAPDKANNPENNEQNP